MVIDAVSTEFSYNFKGFFKITEIIIFVKLLAKLRHPSSCVNINDESLVIGLIVPELSRINKGVSQTKH